MISEATHIEEISSMQRANDRHRMDLERSQLERLNLIRQVASLQREVENLKRIICAMAEAADTVLSMAKAVE